MGWDGVVVLFLSGAEGSGVRVFWVLSVSCTCGGSLQLHMSSAAVCELLDRRSRGTYALAGVWVH